MQCIDEIWPKLSKLAKTAVYSAERFYFVFLY